MCQSDTNQYYLFIHRAEEKGQREATKREGEKDWEEKREAKKASSWLLLTHTHLLLLCPVSPSHLATEGLTQRISAFSQRQGQEEAEPPADDRLPLDTAVQFIDSTDSETGVRDLIQIYEVLAVSAIYVQPSVTNANAE